MAKKVGTLIKEARTAAGLSQEALAKKITGVSANDISLAERGEKDLTQMALKEIAKATGVTQKSLLDAAKQSTAGSAGKTSSRTSGKTGAAGKTSSKTSGKTGSAGKTSSKTSGKSGTAGKTSSKSSHTTGTAAKKGSASSAFKLSAEEKKLIQAYRGADEKIRTTVKMLLLGTEGISSGTGLAGIGSAGLGELLGSGDLLNSLVGSVKNLLG